MYVDTKPNTIRTNNAIVQPLLNKKRRAHLPPPMCVCVVFVRAAAIPIDDPVVIGAHDAPTAATDEPGEHGIGVHQRSGRSWFTSVVATAGKTGFSVFGGKVTSSFPFLLHSLPLAAACFPSPTIPPSLPNSQFSTRPGVVVDLAASLARYMHSRSSDTLTH